jgi:cytidine deaminase
VSIRKKATVKASTRSARGPAWNDLYLTAVEVRKNSHSPYSGHKVGAAIRLENGQIFGGCNVENSSYGGTVCAERVAIQTAVAALGPKKVRIQEVVVVTAANPPWPPCGFCRQVLAEFGTPGTDIHAAHAEKGPGTEAGTWSTTLGELLPDAFTPHYLASPSDQKPKTKRSVKKT